MYRRQVRVIYPLDRGRMVLRSEADWGRDIEPTGVDEARATSTFELSAESGHLDFKPCLRDGDAFYWAAGANKLVTLPVAGPRDVYPYFFANASGEVSDILKLPSEILGREVRMRIYLPAGYGENPHKRYPVIYMHDGRNLFFPEEAFLGQDWQIDETLGVLDMMNAIDPTIVIGIHSVDRTREFSQPGYEAYARSLVEEVKPTIDARLRTLPDVGSTSVMGSSLGGVVSLYTAWEHPQVFGNVACLSSTFWYQNDLLERVHRDDFASRRHLRIYLDSGWPRDNYEVTLSMAYALVEAGFRHGTNLLHFAFPFAEHSEDSWAARSHLPLQFFSGRLARHARELPAASL
jgi:predicted alpha/beta superfamily hydrolase